MLVSQAIGSFPDWMDSLETFHARLSSEDQEWTAVVHFSPFAWLCQTGDCKYVRMISSSCSFGNRISCGFVSFVACMFPILDQT